MIIQKCDICGDVVSRVNTVILYKDYIDYCNKDKCKTKIEKIVNEFKKEIDFEYNILFNSLSHKEEKIIKKIKKGEQKI